MSADYAISRHAAVVLAEREIDTAWVWEKIASPDYIWTGADGNTHFASPIPERGNRILHVVINELVNPKVVVTAFFDRRLSRRES